MPRLAIRGLSGPHVIKACNVEKESGDSIFTLQFILQGNLDDSISLDNGTYEIDIYKLDLDTVIQKSNAFGKSNGITRLDPLHPTTPYSIVSRQVVIIPHEKEISPYE
jgi:hypothetical protein